MQEFGHQHDHETFLGGIVSDITGGGPGSPLHPTREMELAGELLGAQGEHEFEQFVRDVYSSVGETSGRTPGPEAGQSLAAILKDAARRALPLVARALGDKYGRSSQWAHLAEAAGSLLGLELEGLSPQDQEFESARQFVRFASAAAEHAAAAPSSLSPEIVAQAAATAAAHRFAPGLAHEIAVDHRRASGRARPAYTPPRPRYTSGPVVRDHRTTVSRPAYGRPATVYGRPSYARGWPVSWQRPGYGTPAAWRPGGYGRWGWGWTRPQYGGWQGRYPGWYGGYRPGSWGWQRGGWSWPTWDWSRFRTFFGDAPPGAPSGAPGRWVYRGRHHGRRRWAWVPLPDAQPFVAPAQPPDSGPPEGGGDFPTIEEPAPSAPPDQTVPMPPPAPIDPTAAVTGAPPAPPPDQPMPVPMPIPVQATGSTNGGSPAPVGQGSELESMGKEQMMGMYEAEAYPGSAYYPGEFEGEGEYPGQFEAEGEYPGQFEGEGEYPGQFEGGYPGEFEGEGEYEHSYGAGLLQAAAGETYGQPGETELAAELLEISSEEEMEEFLDGIFKAATGLLGGGVGKALGGLVSNVAKTALPVLGGTLGSFVAPGIGTAIGSKLGSLAGGLFGETGYELSYEEEQFETAKKVVQLATTAAQIAQAAPPNLPPQVVAQQAVQQAAQQLGVDAGPQHEGQFEGEGEGEWGGGYRGRRYWRSPYRSGYGGYGGYGQQAPYGDDQQGGGQSGQWVRRGNRIVIYGA